jgi:hypothetical protein
MMPVLRRLIGTAPPAPSNVATTARTWRGWPDLNSRPQWTVPKVLATLPNPATCPYYPAKRYEDWNLDDPADGDINHVRPIRDEIKRRVERLISDLQPIQST